MPTYFCLYISLNSIKGSDMHIKNYLKNIETIAKSIDQKKLQKLLDFLIVLKKKGGRLFFLGVGGSAANCSHAVNDFRKLCNIESYAPTDNVAELTARINDEGWDNSFVNWLKISKISSMDVIFIFSVGGGNLKRNISVNIVNAIKYAKIKKTIVLSIVGRDDGYAYKNSDCALLVPVMVKKLLTPVTESFQAVIWHLLVSHPKLQSNNTKW
jgi:D-sedoheptulose 7-phosphate isomerase